MGRPAKMWWKEIIRERAANHPDQGAARLAMWAKAEGERTGTASPPSERTVGRWLNEFGADERAEYRAFVWPDSMLDGLLPWEAGECGLELLLMCIKHKEERPSVRVVKWFHRVTLALPMAPLGVRGTFARIYAAHEAIGVVRPFAGDGNEYVDDFILAYERVKDYESEDSGLWDKQRKLYQTGKVRLNMAPELDGGERNEPPAFWAELLGPEGSKRIDRALFLPFLRSRGGLAQ